MFSTAEKSTSTSRTNKTPETSPFFRKAGDESFFGARKTDTFFRSVKPKLNVSTSEHPAEKEADTVAASVMRMPEPSKSEEEQLRPQKDLEGNSQKTLEKNSHSPVADLNRKEEPADSVKTEEEEKEEEENSTEILNRKADSNYRQEKDLTSLRAPPEHQFLKTLNSLNGSGSVLPEPAKNFMEKRFNENFSDVRVHTTSMAEMLSSQIHAQAFVHQNNIYFNAGKFSPHTTAGGLLLAHELTHILQQRGSALKVNYQPKKSQSEGRSAAQNAPPALSSTTESRRNISPGNAEKRAFPSGDAVPARGFKKRRLAPVELEKMNRAPRSLAEDPTFKQARTLIYSEARKQKVHDEPEKKKEEVKNAAVLSPEEQQTQDAVEKTTNSMEKTSAEQKDRVKSFDAEKFAADLRKRINDKKPVNESQAKELAKNPPVEHFEKDFSEALAKEQHTVTGPLEEKAKIPPVGGKEQKTEIPVPKPKTPAKPQKPDPQLATAKARTDEEISLEHESQKIDKEMDDNKLSDDQLAQSREPSFEETLKVKQEAKRRIAEAPAQYRAQEEAILIQAAGQTETTLASDLGAMNNINRKTGKNVFGGQQTTETHTEKRQRQIKEHIDRIYQDTVGAVKGILKEMSDKVKEDFSNSLKIQTELFNSNVRSRISDYYGDWRIDDAILGPSPVVVREDGSTRAMTLEEKFGVKPVESINPDVYEIFVEEKNAFLQAMEVQITAIAENVESGLTRAHNEIVAAEERIANFKKTLSKDEQEYASQLEAEVKLKFESLEESIDDTREDLLETLSSEYSETVDQLEKTFKDINDELKKSWIDRAIEFVKTVGKTIFELADLLFSILTRIAYLVWDIIKHPIRFFETLVSGLMEGIGAFIGNIGEHMKEAFWTWISGANPGKNIRITAGSGIVGMFGMVLQVLDLGADAIRNLVRKRLGSEFLEVIDAGVALGEKLLEPVQILIKKGPLAFWDYLKETLAETIQSNIERIKQTVFYAFIEEGLKWIAGFFIPGGGFVKIVKAIVKAFQFVAENLANIKHFFESVFDSMDAAVQGNTAAVANKIVAGLKVAVVLALDFLAKQLGLDKIVDKVQKIIQSLRKPIVSAIDFILLKAKPLVTRMLKKGKELIKKGKEKVSAAAGKVLSFLGIKKNFKDKEGEGHKLYFRGSEKNPDLILESTPIHIGSWISKRKQELSDAGKLTPQLSNLFAQLHNLMQEIKQLTYKDKKAKRTPEEVVNDIARILVSIGVGGEHPVPRMLVDPGFSSAKAGDLQVRYLFNDRNNHQPGDPSEGRGDLHGAFTEIQQLGVKRDWDRGHLLNEEFGGLAVNSNLIPMPKTTNLNQYKVFDRGIRSLFTAKKVIWIRITLSRNHDNDPQGRFVSELKGTAGTMDFNSAQGTWKEDPAQAKIDLNKTHLFRPQKVQQSAISINDSIRNKLSDRMEIRKAAGENGISARLMEALIKRGTPVKSTQEIESYIKSRTDWAGGRMIKMLNMLDYAVTHNRIKLD